MKNKGVIILVLICFIITVGAGYVGFKESKKTNSVVPDSGNKINNNGNNSNTNNDSNGLSLFKGEPTIDFYINDPYGNAMASVKIPNDLNISTLNQCSEIKDDNTEYIFSKSASNYLTMDEKSKSSVDGIIFLRFILELGPRNIDGSDAWNNRITKYDVKYLKDNICYYYYKDNYSQSFVTLLYLLKNSKGEESVLWAQYDTSGKTEEEALKYVDVIYNFINIL